MRGIAEEVFLVQKKLVFEEIDSEVSGSNLDQHYERQPRDSVPTKYSQIWLFTLLVMIIIMVIVGGITRLTDSGLSIVEWDLIGGILPPFNEVEWLVQFEKYKTIPEFSLVNSDITLQKFKIIFYWEWGHRLWGRLIGIVWLVGFGVIVLSKMAPPGWSILFFLIGALIGLQGLVGWLMVQSGFSDGMTDVASYWLAAHLGLAFSIIALIQWYLLLLRRDSAALMLGRRNRDRFLNRWVNFFLIILSFQIIFGGLVAGIDAGTSYTDWPFMAGEIFPSEYFSGNSSWIDSLENPAFVQFNHRVTAYLLVLVSLFIWVLSRRNPVTFIRKLHLFLFLGVVFQLTIGIITVLTESTVEIALIHQFCGLVLWLMAIWVQFETAYPKRQRLN